MKGREIAVWALLFVPVVGVSIAASMETPLAGELPVVHELQTWGWLGGWFADVVRAVTTTQVVVVTGIVVAVALWFAGERRAALGLAVALVLLEIAQPAIKAIVERPRPTDDLVDVRGSITSPSFPAGHVMSPIALYGFVAAVAALRAEWPGMLRVLLIGLAACVFAATSLVNLYLGVHWPLDVVGAWSWGAIVVGAGLEAEHRIPLGEARSWKRPPR